MANEIEKFDPSTLMQGVKNRIKATFVSLIPDDQWEVMVNKEIEAFFKPVEVKHSESRKQKYSGYGYSGVEWNKEHIAIESPFRRLVWAICEEKTIEVLKIKLNNQWFTNNWPITDENMTEQLKELTIKAAPIAMVKFFESLSLVYVNQLRDDIQNHKI